MDDFPRCACGHPMSLHHARHVGAWTDRGCVMVQACGALGCGCPSPIAAIANGADQEAD